MAKEMFYAAIDNAHKRVIDSQFPNVVFISSSNSKVELLYKNFSCKVIEKNYRYVLDTEDEIKQNNDFFSIFENSLFVQKTLRESPESKVVFVIDSGCIFNARAREFTNWLELIDKSFGSQNLFNSSCLVIESVSKDSDPILELQSLMKDSFNRISDINLKLLGNWLADEKFILIEKFSKKDLGKYEGVSFQKELNHILQKCSSVSYLDPKPFLSSETVDSQRAFYKEISNEMFENTKNFVTILYKGLTEVLRKSADTCDFNQFEKDYHNILTKLDVQEHLVYKSMLNFCNVLNIEPLQKITESIKQLEDVENKATSLMSGVLDLHDLDMHGLDFRNNINNLKIKLKEDWDESITKAGEVIRTYSDLYTLFELNEKCKLDSKKIGLEFYWKKREIATKQEVNKLFESNKEFCSSFDKIQYFCRSDNQLKQTIIRSLETYSKLSPLYEIIYQSIIESSTSHSSAAVEIFVNLYAQHVKNLYAQLYDEYNDVITNLEKEHHDCAWHRENIKVFLGGGVGGGIVTGGVTAGVIALSGGTGGIFALAALPFLGTLGIYMKKKEISENLDYSLKDSFKSVEKYYKQLPKDLREGWANINTFPKLSEYLKKTYPENKIYSYDDEQYNNSNVQMLAIEEDKESKNLVDLKKEKLLQSNDDVLLSGNHHVDNYINDLD